MNLINKTVYITFDEATRLVDACKGSDGAITKEFFDWYLGDGHFFAQTGMLVIDNLPAEKERVAVSFDFSDPDVAMFVSYNYSDQKVISRFSFQRHENLSMTDITPDVKDFWPDALIKSANGQIWFSPETKERFLKISDEIARLEKKRRLQKIKKTKTEFLVDIAMRGAYIEINKFNCRAFIYFTYALMFSASKQEPEEIFADFRDEINIDNEKVKAIYKYSGYVNLTDNKIYRPIVKKDPDEPAREYQRHIQKWTVRGHYRRTAKGLIWIGEHEKGEGQLENRVYGTQEESDVPIIPKIFEVLRTKRKYTSNRVVRTAIFRRFLDKVAAFFSNFFNVANGA